MIDKILKFAIETHGQQMYGDKPYSYHLTEVVEQAKPYGLLAQIIAALHDVKEDTDISDDSIINFLNQFEDLPAEPLFIVKCLHLISDEDGKNRKEKKLKTNLKLSLIEKDFYVVLIVKSLDRFCNTKHSYNSKSSLFEMYKREYPEFKKSVYREGLCDEVWNSLDRLMYQ